MVADSHVAVLFVTDNNKKLIYNKIKINKNK